MDRAEKGEPIRIGFSIIKPSSFIDENGKPVGRIVTTFLDVLEDMGYDPENIEVTTMDWGGLIPALQADRIDIITSGMYITKERCDNIGFSNPFYFVPDALVVPKGNPMGLENYEDIAEQGATIAQIAGYATIATAKRAGIPEDKMMVLPGQTQVLAALKAGRADVFAGAGSETKAMVDSAPDQLEEVRSETMSADTVNYVSIGFRQNDADFIEAFNAKLADYLGSDEMLSRVEGYDYNKAMVPAEDMTSAAVCAIR
jgi:polar amino acid transport system substrate-binding protein